MNLESVLEQLKDPLRLVTKTTEQRRLKSYTKLIEDLFVDPGSNIEKQKNQYVYQARGIDAKKWNNIPFCIIDSIDCMSNLMIMFSDTSYKNTNVFRDIINNVTFNTEIVMEKIDERFEQSCEREVMMWEQLINDRPQIIATCNESASQMLDEMRANIIQNVERMVKREINDFKEIQQTEFQETISKLKKSIKTQIQAYDKENLAVPGLIGAEEKFLNVGAYIKHTHETNEVLGKISELQINLKTTEDNLKKLSEQVTQEKQHVNQLDFALENEIKDVANGLNKLQLSSKESIDKIGLRMKIIEAMNNSSENSVSGIEQKLKSDQQRIDKLLDQFHSFKADHNTVEVELKEFKKETGEYLQQIEAKSYSLAMKIESAIENKNKSIRGNGSNMNVSSRLKNSRGSTLTQQNKSIAQDIEEETDLTFVKMTIPQPDQSVQRVSSKKSLKSKQDENDPKSFRSQIESNSKKTEGDEDGPIQAVSNQEIEFLKSQITSLQLKFETLNSQLHESLQDFVSISHFEQLQKKVTQVVVDWKLFKTNMGPPEKSKKSDKNKKTGNEQSPAPISLAPPSESKLKVVMQNVVASRIQSLLAAAEKPELPQVISPMSKLFTTFKQVQHPQKPFDQTANQVKNLTPIVLNENVNNPNIESNLQTKSLRSISEESVKLKKSESIVKDRPQEQAVVTIVDEADAIQVQIPSSDNDQALLPNNINRKSFDSSIQLLQFEQKVEQQQTVQPAPIQKPSKSVSQEPKQDLLQKQQPRVEVLYKQDQSSDREASASISIQQQSYLPPVRHATSSLGQRDDYQDQEMIQSGSRRAQQIIQNSRNERESFKVLGSQIQTSQESARRLTDVERFQPQYERPSTTLAMAQPIRNSDTLWVQNEFNQINNTMSRKEQHNQMRRLYQPIPGLVTDSRARTIENQNQPLGISYQNIL